MRGETGTSLIELMFAMAAGLVVFSATLQALSYFQHQFMRQQREVSQQQDLRLGLEVLEQELRMAGSDSLTIVASDSVEFSANLQSLSTTLTAMAEVGQTTLSVEDGREWNGRKQLWSVGLNDARRWPWLAMDNGTC
jgi:Tfp pilus assembly protein PilW